MLFVCHDENPSLFVHVWARAYSSGYIEIVFVLFVFFSRLFANPLRFFFYSALSFYIITYCIDFTQFPPNDVHTDLGFIFHLDVKFFYCMSAVPTNAKPLKRLVKWVFVFILIWATYNIVSRFKLLIVIFFLFGVRWFLPQFFSTNTFRGSVKKKSIFFVHFRTLMTLLIIKVTSKYEQILFQL